MTSKFTGKKTHCDEDAWRNHKNGNDTEEECVNNKTHKKKMRWTFLEVVKKSQIFLKEEEGDVDFRPRRNI